MATYKRLEEIGDIAGKKVLVRSELNTPIEGGVVSDNYRVEKAVPTLQWLSEHGAKVIVMAHLGRKPEDSLRPVLDEIQKILPKTKFVKDVIGEDAQTAVDALQNGEVLLLENLRSNPGEKANDESFGKVLASLADIYVDDAFGASHREHASIVGVPKYLPSYAGLLMDKEVTELHSCLVPESPSLFILGGAKFETKEPLLKTVLERYDQVFIGGALANDFLKAKGFRIGKSLVSETDSESIRVLTENEKIILPTDVVVEGEHGVVTKAVDMVEEGDRIVDVGPESITELGVKVTHAKTIVWNGPLGFYEGGFIKSTEEVAQLIADAEGYSVLGGGDTVASIRTMKLENKVSFVSTGGGAMLDYLVDGKLPGVQALKN